jgi:DNA-binding MarR family transcriptional regulator
MSLEVTIASLTYGGEVGEMRSVSYADSLAFLLSQVGARSGQLFARQLADLTVSPREFGVLSNLELVDGQSQQQLADAIGLHRNNMVALIDELEAKGWVRRERNQQDRRASSIRLTPAGARIVRQVSGLIPAVEQDIARSLSAEERATLAALLRRVADQLGLQPGLHPHLLAARNRSA